MDGFGFVCEILQYGIFYDLENDAQDSAFGKESFEFVLDWRCDVLPCIQKVNCRIFKVGKNFYSVKHTFSPFELFLITPLSVIEGLYDKDRLLQYFLCGNNYMPEIIFQITLVR